MTQERRLSILVADDSVDILRMIDAVISAHLDSAHVVGHAINTDETIQQVKRKHPDVVILDLMMPGSPRGRGRVTGSGLDAIPIIKEVSPKTVIVAYSAVRQLLDDALVRGADKAYDKLEWPAMLDWLKERFHVSGTP